MNDKIYYTGIGSREIPDVYKEIVRYIATDLAMKGCVLRSGGADGSDLNFEFGCDAGNGEKEIYLPWKGFNESQSKLIVSKKEAFDIAKKYHPAWNKLTQGARKLHARNVHQVLGMNLDRPSNFVICYTKDGKGQGGTGQALRIAKAYGILIFDIGCYTDLNQLMKNLGKWTEERLTYA
jgi:hypothetical protein